MQTKEKVIDCYNKTAEEYAKKFTDELIEKKLNEEGGWRRWLGWDKGPQGRKRREELQANPWENEPGWDPAPGPLPEDTSQPIESASSSSSSSSDSDDVTEKSNSTPSKISKPDANKKPKKIRKIDIPKYYPQYKQNDTGDPTTSVGIGVA